MSSYVADLVEAILRLIRSLEEAGVWAMYGGVVTKLVAVPAEVSDVHLRQISGWMAGRAATTVDRYEASHAYLEIREQVKTCHCLYRRAVALQRKAVADAVLALRAAARNGNDREVFILTKRVEFLSKELDKALGRE